ncbi:MAG TPA: hypothetical protein VFE12_11355, partial [Acetobacteraceae bacterium]|nr:hypothetical protein [Acetobacteraceae bacterium]
MNARHWSMLGSAAGVAVAFALWQAIGRSLPFAPPLNTAERLGWACASLLPAVCLLNLMIVAQMRLRVSTDAIDPLAGNDGAKLRLNQRVLSNTVEQLAGFAPALLAL